MCAQTCVFSPEPEVPCWCLALSVAAFLNLRLTGTWKTKTSLTSFSLYRDARLLHTPLFPSLPPLCCDKLMVTSSSRLLQLHSSPGRAGRRTSACTPSRHCSQGPVVLVPTSPCRMAVESRQTLRVNTLVESADGVSSDCYHGGKSEEQQRHERRMRCEKRACVCARACLCIHPLPGLVFEKRLDDGVHGMNVPRLVYEVDSPKPCRKTVLEEHFTHSSSDMLTAVTWSEVLWYLKTLDSQLEDVGSEFGGLFEGEVAPVNDEDETVDLELRVLDQNL